MQFFTDDEAGKQAAKICDALMCLTGAQADLHKAMLALRLDQPDQYYCYLRKAEADARAARAHIAQVIGDA